MRKLLAAVAIGALLKSSALFAASLPLLQGAATADPSQMQAVINGVIQSINSNISTGAGTADPKNVLDNSAFSINARGTGTATCATTAGPTTTAYVSDRWACDVNVTSGAGTGKVATTPTPPIGFTNALSIYRTSGALAQPQCLEQEVPNAQSMALAGQNVVFSAYLEALAGLAADNGSAVNLWVAYGTDAGGDKGLGASYAAVGMSTSPAITPFWTNITTLGGTAQTITTSWARYNSGIVTIPSTATEIAVLACFTPTTTSSGGTTDGFAMDGPQLEAVGPNATGPTAYTFKTPALETVNAALFYFRQLEPAAGVAIAACGEESTANMWCNYVYPVSQPMYAVPTLTITQTATSEYEMFPGASGTAILPSGSGSVTSLSAGVSSARLQFVGATTPFTAGYAGILAGQGGAGHINATADF
jgi:hypothetical protein